MFALVYHSFIKSNFTKKVFHYVGKSLKKVGVGLFKKCPIDLKAILWNETSVSRHFNAENRIPGFWYDVRLCLLSETLLKGGDSLTERNVTSQSSKQFWQYKNLSILL